MPHRTLLHEIAHVVLGHTGELSRMDDGQEHTPRCLREVEAESVALICCESLGLPGAEFSRGYIQHWMSSDQIPERSGAAYLQGRRSDPQSRARIVSRHVACVNTTIAGDHRLRLSLIRMRSPD